MQTSAFFRPLTLKDCSRKGNDEAVDYGGVTSGDSRSSRSVGSRDGGGGVGDCSNYHDTLSEEQS